MSTPYHARFFALELRRRAAAGDVEAVGTALFDAKVDLNPHQIEAALFGLQATQERGRLLADEVGLGKTIEAGLVLCQRWAERRRRLLVICPASLRKQWCQEIESKFGLPTKLAEGRNEGGNPFDIPAVVVCSYPFAAKRTDKLLQVPWDLVVCDEAHRLRNAWQVDNRMARALSQALARTPKLLVTATPLQNTLMELYGLVSVVDDKVFGDLQTFRARFMKGSPDHEEIRRRLSGVCQRTLRRDVLAYVRYTERRSLTQRFRPSSPEIDLYRAVTEFLAREDLVSLPPSQRGLLRMVLRKLLASSSSAIAGALDTMRTRLASLLEAPPEEGEANPWEDEGWDDEWSETIPETGGGEQLPLQGPAAVKAELSELERLASLARAIQVDQRCFSLLEALTAGFKEMDHVGAPRKAVIFTESRRTQEALRVFLSANGYSGQIVCFNGTNSDAEASAILDAWLQAHPGARAAGSRAANMRAALVDRFRDQGTLLIATEAGAEGLNLQFCSLVVNYDLPWNPQRIEQRIGRCHRYGQKYDVVVVNFLDETNAADARVLELLTDKFQLFTGVFGASDELLGAINGGAGFELRIHSIFDTCRSPEAIEAAFAALRAEMEEVIQAREEKARRAILEHFDADVHERLRVRLGEAKARLDHVGRMFWSLTRWALADAADFPKAQLAFDLRHSPVPEVPTGRYELVDRTGNQVADAYVYRMSHPLGQHVLDTGERAATPVARVVFDTRESPIRVMPVEALRGRSGWLRMERLRIEGMDVEEHILASGWCDDGSPLDPETALRLFEVEGRVEAVGEPSEAKTEDLEGALNRLRGAVIAEAGERNTRSFTEARDRLDRWSEDQILAAEIALKEIRQEIRALERKSRAAPTLAEQQEIQRSILDAETRQRKARQRVFAIEDEVRERRNALYDELERRVAQQSHLDALFTIAWSVV